MSKTIIQFHQNTKTKSKSGATVAQDGVAKHVEHSFRLN